MAQINKPSEYFNTKLYTGNGTAIGSGGNAITGVGFQPDFVWVKSRSDAENHNLCDVVRGGTKIIYSNSSYFQETQTESIASFQSDGFTVGNYNQVNTTSYNYASWNWLAGGTGVSNTDGSITSTVSANTTSGFSIVSYTGNGTAGATVGHGLGATPKMMLIKQLNSSNLWRVYHSSLGATNVIYLNSTDATDTGQGSVNFNNTAPSSSVFTLGTNVAVNGSGNTFVAYVFAEKKGFSKFGSYTGNGSTDGTFVYTGFKPAFVMIKVTNGVDNWFIFDNRRSTSGGNVVDDYLYPNLSNAEGGTDILDFLSNGFKLRTTDGGQNGSSNYIYMAFAENPLVGTNNIPATAR